MRQPFNVLEAMDETAEAAPGVFGRAVAMMEMAPRSRAGAMKRKAGDLWGAQVDQEIELAMGVA